MRKRFARMDGERAIWLVSNASSGSNDDDALAALETCCGAHGFRVARRTVFPEEPLPTPGELDAAGLDMVAVYAGDGTTNSLITALAGWRGSVLVLPGGTKNLLFHRLHGQSDMERVVAAVAADRATLQRPGVIRHPAGVAYAELLAGPGASWGRVREAMREAALGEFAEATAEALGETLAGAAIGCVAPPLGRPEGYPLIVIRARDEGLQIVAYHAEGATEYLAQAWAMVTRNFREGPHDILGMAGEVRLASEDGEPFDLLIDGEQVQVGSPAEFRLAPCEVDLVATGRDGF